MTSGSEPFSVLRIRTPIPFSNPAWVSHASCTSLPGVCASIASVATAFFCASSA